MKKLRILSRISRKWKSLLAFWTLESEAREYPLQLFHICQNSLSASVYESLHDHVHLIQRSGFPAEVRTLTKQIPSEYIGILEVWSEGKLLYQKYLQIQTVCVEKSHMYSCPLSPEEGSVCQVF